MKSITALTVGAALALAACADPASDPVSALAPAASRAALGASDLTPVMTGLDNPRGLAFGPDGALYVAEAGRGGLAPYAGPSFCFVNTQNFCTGTTGAVSRLRDGVQQRIVTGLPSYSNKAGRAEGPNSIAVHGNGGAYVTIGLEGNPALRDLSPQLAGFGRLVHISPSVLAQDTLRTSGRPNASPHGDWEFVADLAAYEMAANPDCGLFDSNPFGLLAEPSSPSGLLIVETGSNSIIRRAPNGELSTFISLPSRHTPQPSPSGCPEKIAGDPVIRETVPTSVVVGPDGAHYVGQLAGFPLVIGAARVFRVVPGEAPTVFRTGFTFVIGVAFDAQENLYVLQHTNGPNANTDAGSLIRVAPDGSRTTVVSGLTKPTGLVMGPDEALYISHRGTSVGIGEVLRYVP